MHQKACIPMNEGQQRRIKSAVSSTDILCECSCWFGSSIERARFKQSPCVGKSLTIIPFTVSTPIAPTSPNHIAKFGSLRSLRLLRRARLSRLKVEPPRRLLDRKLVAGSGGVPGLPAEVAVVVVEQAAALLARQARASAAPFQAPFQSVVVVVANLLALLLRVVRRPSDGRYERALQKPLKHFFIRELFCRGVHFRPFCFFFTRWGRRTGSSLCVARFFSL